MAAKKARTAKQKAATKKLIAFNKARKAPAKKTIAKKAVRKSPVKAVAKKRTVKSLSKQRGYAIVQKRKTTKRKSVKKMGSLVSGLKSGAIAVGVGSAGALAINALVTNLPVPAMVAGYKTGYKGSILRILAGVAAGVAIEAAGYPLGRHVAIGTATVETTKYAEKMISEKMPSIKFEGLNGAGAGLTDDEIALIESLDLEDSIDFDTSNNNVLSFAGIGSTSDNLKVYD